MRTRLAALALALPLALGTAATAAPNDVIADYFLDGRLDADYPVGDLRAALAFARERVGSGTQYTAFADIVGEAITRDLAGTDAAAEEQLKAQEPGANPRTETTPPPDPAGVVEPGADLPTPPPTDPNGDLPSAVPIMGFVALGLVAIGSASAIMRRRRRAGDATNRKDRT